MCRVTIGPTATHAGYSDRYNHGGIIVKVYISGAISGLTQDEYEHNFGLAEALIMNSEHEPVNPIKVQACEHEDCWERYNEVRGLPTPGGGGPTKADGTTFLHHYSCYMKHDIAAMLDCDAIVMLPNWITSKGAVAELEVAKICGMKVWYLTADYKEIF